MVHFWEEMVEKHPLLPFTELKISLIIDYNIFLIIDYKMILEIKKSQDR